MQVELAFRTYGSFLSVRTAVVCGGVSQHPQVRALARGLDVLVATPGRLLDLIGHDGDSLARALLFRMISEQLGDRPRHAAQLGDYRRAIELCGWT